MSTLVDDNKTAELDAVENVEIASNQQEHHASGTVKLYQDGAVILVPTPSPDPKGDILIKVYSFLGQSSADFARISY